MESPQERRSDTLSHQITEDRSHSGGFSRFDLKVMTRVLFLFRVSVTLLNETNTCIRNRVVDDVNSVEESMISLGQYSQSYTFPCSEQVNVSEIIFKMRMPSLRSLSSPRFIPPERSHSLRTGGRASFALLIFCLH